MSFVSTPDLFRDQPVLTSQLVRLEPLTLAVVDDYFAATGDPDVTRLTGTHATFDRPSIEAWLVSRQEHHDRADWAVVRAEDNAFLGEAVLNELDSENKSVNYRVWLGGRISSAEGTERRPPGLSSTMPCSRAVSTG